MENKMDVFLKILTNILYSSFPPNAEKKKKNAIHATPRHPKLLPKMKHPKSLNTQSKNAGNNQN